MGRIWAKWGPINKLGLFQTLLGGLGGGTTPGKFCNFYLYLNWHKILKKYEQFFSLKTGNRNLGSPLSYKHTVTDSLTKYAIKGTSKISILLLFSELGKTWRYNIVLYSNPARVTFKNPKISLWIGKNLEFQPKPKTQNFESMDKWGKFVS